MNITLFVIAYLIVLTLAVGAVSAAPWIPTRRRQRRRLAELLPIRPGETVCDLGCGDGVVLFAFADRYPGIRAVGYEIAILPFVIGRVRRSFGGKRYGDVEINYGNFFWEDLSDTDVAFVFLLEKAFPKVMAKLAAELKDDARVVVEAWPFPGVSAEREIREEGMLPTYVYTGRAIRVAVGRDGGE